MDDKLVIHAAVGTQATNAHAHRVERYMDLGFSEADAQLLAVAKDRLGFFLYWGRVAKALNDGCSHPLALRIFT